MALRVQADADRWWAEWRKRRGHRDEEPLGVLSAWVADMERLGKRAKARRELRKALRRGQLKSLGTPWTSGRKYLRELDRFLKALGYRQ